MPSKRVRQEALEQNDALLKVPDEMLGMVCSFLVVRDALDFVTLVVRRPWLRIPWNSLDKMSVRCQPYLTPVYRTVRQLALLQHLEVLDVRLSPRCVASVQAILKGATSLRCLNVRLYDRCSTLLLLVVDMPTTITDLVVGVDLFDDDDVLDSNTDLATFLRSFGCLSRLALHFYTSWSGATGGLVASTISTQLRALRTLEITGVEVEQDVLNAIASCCPALSQLTITLTAALAQGVLCKLQGLTACTFEARHVCDVDFVQHMGSLQVLHIWFDRDEDHDAASDNPLLLPPGLREFRCCSTNDVKLDVLILSTTNEGPRLEVVELPASILLSCRPAWFVGLRTLVCILEPADVLGLLSLFASLTHLENLHLKASSMDTREEVMRLLATTDLASPISDLVLENFEYEPGCLMWLQGFPDLVNLDLRDGRNEGDPDLKRAEAFKACPKLRSIVDSSTGRTVTVSRTDDGRLIKRMDDRVSELHH